MGFCVPAFAQAPPKLYWHNADTTSWLKATFTNQTWVRYTEMNPGSSIYGTPTTSYFDISLRRTRMQLMGNWGRFFFYTQFGMNNFNWHSTRKTGAFFHDALGEIAFVPKKLSLGAGLTAWSGLSRYASPSVANILGYDAPLYEQATNDVNDQFLRKLSIYTKGQLGRLDYRLAISSPMAIQNATVSLPPLGVEKATFSTRPPRQQLQGYVQYMLWDKEDNTTPYMNGTYLGKKKMLTLGAGFVQQQDAMWYLKANGTDTATHNMTLLSIDAFMEKPLNPEKRNAITAYAALQHMDFGPDFVRNLGVNNPATTGGNSFPLIGTGTLVYIQGGYLFGKDLLGRWGTLQVAGSWQHNQLEALDQAVNVYEGTLNWLTNGQNMKLSLGYQSRPVFLPDSEGNMLENTRKVMYVLQWQVSI